MSGSGWFTIVVVAEAVAVALAKWPNQLLFGAYAFGDQGANLATYQLLAEGWRPVTDFNYIYGLLALLFGRLVFAAFGCTPLVYALATSAMAVGVAALLARTAVVLGVPLAGRVFLVAALPLAVNQLPQLNFAHAIEAVLLAAALYWQASGKDSWALAAATAAVLAKPALGYFYGLVLLVRLAVRTPPGPGSRARRFALALLPAAAIGAGLLLLLGAWFGPEPVAGTLLPLKARVVYEREGFGFFTGMGRAFWRPDGANYRYYLGTPAGFWLAATVFLVATGLFAAAKRARGGAGSPADGIVVSCAVLHLAFILFAFGNNYSWTFYAYLLVAGVAAAAALGKWPGRVVWVLAASAVLGQYSEARWVAETWRERRASPATAGLYATGDFAADWGRILDLTRTRRVFVLNYIGAAWVVEPMVDSTRAFCLYPWMATPRERDDLLDRLRAADVVAIPRHNLSDIKHQPRDIPWVAEALAEFPHRAELGAFTLLSRTPLEPHER